MRNLASSLILTERDAELDENAPKVKGRVVTTLQKAKEVRPLVERCVTIARRSLAHQSAAEEFASHAARDTEQWKTWRQSDQWQQWNAKIAPALAARRHALRLLGDKQAVRILFDEIAPRFVDRPGGYTRILKLAQPRLGDAGARAILEFVGVHDRQATKSTKPSFDDTPQEPAAADAEEPPRSQAETSEDVVESAVDDALPAGEEASAEQKPSDADETTKG
jgi:large subunit ribosomal protein L17